MKVGLSLGFVKWLLICFLALLFAIFSIFMAIEVSFDKIIFAIVIVVLFEIFTLFLCINSFKTDMLKIEDELLKHFTASKLFDDSNILKNGNFSRLKVEISKLYEKNYTLEEKIEQLKEVDNQLIENNDSLRNANNQLKISKTEIEKNEHYLKTLINNHGEGLLICDVLGMITFVSDSFVSLVNISIENIIGNSVFSLVSEDNAKIIKQQMANRSLGVKSSYELTVSINGKEHCILVSASPNFNQENIFIGSIAVLSDVSELRHYQKETELKNIELTKFYSAVCQNFSGIVLMDSLGIINFVNPSFEKMSGYSEQDLKNCKLESLIFDSGSLSVYEYIKALLDSGRAWKGELVGLKKDRTHYLLRATISPIKNEKNNVIGFVGVFDDVSKLKSIERELAETERRYSLIIRNSRDVIWIFNTEQKKITFVSPAIKRLCGFTEEEFVNQSINKSFDATTSAKLEKILNVDFIKNFNKSNPDRELRLEALQYKKDGSMVDVEIVVSTFSRDFSDNQSNEILCISRNISGRKLMEKRLRENNNLLHIILEKLPAKIYMKDRDMKYVMVNSLFANHFGLNAGEFINKTDAQLNIANKTALLKNEVDVINTGKPLIYSEIFINSENEKGVWVSVSQVPFFYRESKPEGVIGIISDITERKLYEQMLLEQNRQFENTIKNLTDIYLRTDLDGVVLQASPSICNFVGIDSISDILGRPINEFLKSNVWSFVAKTGRVVDYSFRLTNLKGKNLYCEMNVVTFYDSLGNKAGYEGIARDVTERVMHEQQLNSLTEDLVKSLEQTKIQKNMIESAHRRIKESLYYAKRIQDALLISSVENINNYLSNNFLIYKPCEIVGGDFVYVKKTAQGLACAMADCTGHGIPGALMSVLSISLLNDIFAVVDSGVEKTTGEILNELRRRIIENLSNSVIMRDGLDICLVLFADNMKDIQFSGANIPLYICRNGQLSVLKANGCPIGLYPLQTDFDSIEFSLQKDDMVYLASDGFADQFGFSENRKFSRRDFANLLLSNSLKGCQQQKTELETALANWQGTRKQTDDITIFGFRVD